MQVMYTVPMASGPARLIIGAACFVFVLAIYCSWLPRAIRWLAKLPRNTATQSASVIALAMIPAVVGGAPLLILIALIRNPAAYVSDVGVMKESLFSRTPTRLAWAQIAHVSCGWGRRAGPRWITLVSSDGLSIGLGNTGRVDFLALQTYLGDRLGPAVMGSCMNPAHKSAAPQAGQSGMPKDVS